MALTAYLKLKGKTSGEIKGDCTKDGEHTKDSILVYGFDHEIEIPKDTHTGLPTGQRIHKAFTITKRVDNATPLVMQACTSGEQMEEWALYLYRISEKGQEEHYYTITLTNAIIVKVNLETPLTFLEENKPFHNMEKVSFTYTGIDHENVAAKITGSDNWATPRN
jgi:type VI secretion system secreted protein Hcp